MSTRGSIETHCLFPVEAETVLPSYRKYRATPTRTITSSELLISAMPRTKPSPSLALLSGAMPGQQHRTPTNTHEHQRFARAISRVGPRAVSRNVEIHISLAGKLIPFSVLTSDGLLQVSRPLGFFPSLLHFITSI